MPPTFERTSGCYVVFHSGFTSQLTFERSLLPLHRSLFLSLVSVSARLSLKIGLYIIYRKATILFHPLDRRARWMIFFYLENVIPTDFFRKKLKFRREHPNRHQGFTGDTCLKYETIIFDVSLNVERSDIPLEYL